MSSRGLHYLFQDWDGVGTVPLATFTPACHRAPIVRQDICSDHP
jgi:hypothetical protein